MRVDGRIQLFPLVRVALAFALGIVVGDALSGVVASWMWLCSLVVALPPLWLWHRRKYIDNRRPVMQTVAVLAAVVLCGALRMSNWLEGQRFEYAGSEETFRAVVASSPYIYSAKAAHGSRRQTARYEFVVADGRFAGHKIYAYSPHGANAEWEKPLSIGDGIVMTARMRPAYDASRDNSHGNRSGSHFDYRRWLCSHDIVARVYSSEGKWHRAVFALDGISGLQRLTLWLGRFRQRLQAEYRDSGLSEDTYAVVAAMTLGDRNALTKDVREAYSVSGASHVLALSGMHLGIIYMLLSLLFERGPRDSYTKVFVLAAIWGYALMVGMATSVVRSAIMCTMFAISYMLCRQNMSLNTLGLAALLLLAISPMNLWDIGFQMSFLAVFGIVFFYDRFYVVVSAKFLQTHRVLGWLWTMLTVPLSAQVMVAPLVVYYFGRFSCYFFLSNYIAVPLATIVIYSSILLCATFFWPWLQGVVATVVEWEVTAMNGALSWVAALPGASIENIRINGLQLALLYVIVALLYCLSFYMEKMYRSAYGVKLEKYVKKGKRT